MKTPIINEFIEKNSFTKRQKETTIIKERYPHKIPVVVVFSPAIEKYMINSYVKYLLSRELKPSYITLLLRKNIKLDPKKAIFLLSENGTLLPHNAEIGDFYNQYKNEDGYLYIHIYSENTFGIKK